MRVDPRHELAAALGDGVCGDEAASRDDENEHQCDGRGEVAGNLMQQPADEDGYGSGAPEDDDRKDERGPSPLAIDGQMPSAGRAMALV